MGERYLVPMLGADVGRVRNAKTESRKVILRHGRRETVRPEEVSRNQRAPC